MDVIRLLKQWNLRPSKGLGQNFLVEQAVLERIVAAAELSSDDVVLEIGPGVGNLTERLIREAGQVVAVELDQRLMPVLEDVLSPHGNVTLIQGDILALDPAALIDASGERYKVVANLPYYVTSAVLRHLLEARLKPRRTVVTVQREVAERIVAQPGEMSLLAVGVQFYGRPRLLFRIKPGSFYPSPGVDSAVVQVDLRETFPVPEEEAEAFFRVVAAGFSQRRKQLRNALAGGLALPRDEVASRLKGAGVDPRRRAQSLTLEEWAAITQVLQSKSRVR